MMPELPAEMIFPFVTTIHEGGMREDIDPIFQRMNNLDIQGKKLVLEHIFNPRNLGKDRDGQIAHIDSVKLIIENFDFNKFVKETGDKNILLTTYLESVNKFASESTLIELDEIKYLFGLCLVNVNNGNPLLQYFYPTANNISRIESTYSFLGEKYGYSLEKPTRKIVELIRKNSLINEDISDKEKNYSEDLEFIKLVNILSNESTALLLLGMINKGKDTYTAGELTQLLWELQGLNTKNNETGWEISSNVIISRMRDLLIPTGLVVTSEGKQNKEYAIERDTKLRQDITTIAKILLKISLRFGSKPLSDFFGNIYGERGRLTTSYRLSIMNGIKQLRKQYSDIEETIPDIKSSELAEVTGLSTRKLNAILPKLAKSEFLMFNSLEKHAPVRYKAKTNKLIENGSVARRTNTFANNILLILQSSINKDGQYEYMTLKEIARKIDNGFDNLSSDQQINFTHGIDKVLSALEYEGVFVEVEESTVSISKAQLKQLLYIDRFLQSFFSEYATENKELLLIDNLFDSSLQAQQDVRMLMEKSKKS